MKRLSFFLFALLIPAAFVSAQERKAILVKGGTRIIDYFPYHERYINSEFTQGTIRFIDGTYYSAKMNYDILSGEVVFIQGKDTMAIARRDIDRVESEADTFFYDNGFLRIVDGHYPVLLLAKQFVKLSNISKEGAYGTSNTTSSVETYTSVYHNAEYNLIEKQDLTISVVKDYYIGNKVIGFTLFKPRNILKLYPEHKKDIEKYLEENDGDFKNYDEMVKFCKFLYTLKTGVAAL